MPEKGFTCEGCVQAFNTLIKGFLQYLDCYNYLFPDMRATPAAAKPAVDVLSTSIGAKRLLHRRKSGWLPLDFRHRNPVLHRDIAGLPYDPGPALRCRRRAIEEGPMRILAHVLLAG